MLVFQPQERRGITGTVDNVVYFGTDTHVHLKLQDGAPFIVRKQNSAGGTLVVGDTVGIGIGSKAARLIRD